MTHAKKCDRFMFSSCSICHTVHFASDLVYRPLPEWREVYGFRYLKNDTKAGKVCAECRAQLERNARLKASNLEAPEPATETTQPERDEFPIRIANDIVKWFKSAADQPPTR